MNHNLKHDVFLFAFSLLVFAFGALYLSFASDTLRVGVIKYKTIAEIEQTYRPIFEYVASETGKKLYFEITDQDELGWRLDRGEFDIGVFKPFPYLKAKSDFAELELFASQNVFGEDSYVGAILVRKDSPISKHSDFKGNKFLFVKPTSTSGYKVPKGIFKERNVDVDSAFFEYDFSYDHQKSVRKLLDGEADGIAIDLEELNFMEDVSLSDFKVISKYKIPNHAYVFSPDMPFEERKRIKKILFNAHKDPKAKSLFDNPLGITEIIEVDDEYYNRLRRYLRIIREKPTLHVELEATESAEAYMDSKGDMVYVLESNIIGALKNTRRFSEYLAESFSDDRCENVVVKLSKTEDDVFFTVYLNRKRLKTGSIYVEKLVDQLHNEVTAAVLSDMKIKTRLLRSGDKYLTAFDKDLYIIALSRVAKSRSNKIATKSEIFTFFLGFFRFAVSLESGAANDRNFNLSISREIGKRFFSGDGQH